MQSNTLDRTRMAGAAGWVVGLGMLGVLSLIFQDFAFQWQPVPKGWPWRHALAVSSGMLLIIGAVCAVPKRTRRFGIGLLTGWISLWVLALHLPATLLNLSHVGIWLGLAECIAIALGGYAFLRSVSGEGLGHRELRALLVAYGFAQIVFGASHFLYPDITASLVPKWLPFPMFLAYLTGVIHAGTGLVVALARWWRLPMIAEASMMSSFVLLVHAPRVLQAPNNRLEWTMLCVALALACSAWLMASSRVRDV